MPRAEPPSKRAPSDASTPAARSFHHGNLRQSLVDAALAEPDIEGLSIRHLAANLGVTPAAVYRHFAGREDLLAEVARIGFDRLGQRFQSVIEIATPPQDKAEAIDRLTRLAGAYLQFADDYPALWRLMFGAQGEVYRAAPNPRGRTSSYEYLPAALLGLHRTGVIDAPPSELDALFAWSAIHGVATLRSGRIPAALAPIRELSSEISLRIVRALS
jgi:AcrR family transcriptional regulator